MSNGTEPASMTDNERLDEVARLFAAGMLRLRAKTGLPRKKRRFFRDNCLEVPVQTSPHAIRI